MNIILGIIGVFIAGATFYFTFYRKPINELNHLKLQFKMTQSISNETQKDIERFADKTDCWNEQIFQGITFREYLRELKDSYQENLSDKLLNDFDNLNLSKSNIESMTKSLEEQFSALQQIQIATKMKMKE